MVSPDVTPYVDLRLYDRSAQQIFDAAIALAVARIPDWIPREGNTEVVLLEALALEVSELTFAINRLPSATTEVLLRLFDVTPNEGTPAVATATFTLSDANGHTVPAGTRLRWDPGDGSGVVDFTTDVALAVTAGQSTGTVAVTASSVGTRANGALVGDDLQLIDSVIYVESVEFATSPSGGSNPEDDAEYLARGVSALSRLVTTLVLPEHFQSFALDDVRVSRAYAIDLYDPATGPNPGDNPGHVTVAVLGEGSALLSASIKTEIEDAMEAATLANLLVHVIDPTITSVDVTVEVTAKAGFATADVQASVETAIEAYLDPQAWAWGDTVYRNELISLIDQVAGVDRVVDITAPVGDAALSGVAPLADAGTITVTVS